MKKLNKTKNIICPLRRHLLKTGHHPFFLILRAKLFFGLISNMVLLIITCFLIFCIFRFIKSCFGGTKRDFHFLEISCFCSVFHLLPLYKPGLKGLSLTNVFPLFFYFRQKSLVFEKLPGMWIFLKK